MSVGSAVRELGRFLEECERNGGSVRDVEVGERSGAACDLEATVDLTLATPFSGDGGQPVSLCPAGIEADGRVRLAVESTEPVVPADEYDVSVEPTDATVTDDGRVALTLATAVPANGDAERDVVGDDILAVTDRDGERQADGGADATEPDGGNRDVPPFEDAELLGEVYDSQDTFAEMAEALEMDVTAETVRRYMIDHGIHQPNSYDTGEDGDEVGSPAVLADGIGLPEGVTVDGFIDTVRQSNTIYEVKEEIGTDREDTLEMLRELNLLDLVTGRLAIEANREIGREEIIERLRQSSRAG